MSKIEITQREAHILLVALESLIETLEEGSDRRAERDVPSTSVDRVNVAARELHYLIADASDHDIATTKKGNIEVTFGESEATPEEVRFHNERSK